LGAWIVDAVRAAGLPTTVGMYTYLDSDAHVRVSLAADAIMAQLAKAQPDVAFAYIQTPSIAYKIGQEAHAASESLYKGGMLQYLGYAKNARPPLTADVGAAYVHDGISNVQGPNYALAKTMQKWRAVLARCDESRVVSMNVAPAARTASMVAGDNKNAGTVAVALDGMGHFKPLVVFDQQTVSSCMAALLIHDLCNGAAPSQPKTPLPHPHDLFHLEAFHGGSFRCGVKPDALGTLFFLAGKLRGAAAAPKA